MRIGISGVIDSKLYCLAHVEEEKVKRQKHFVHSFIVGSANMLQIFDIKQKPIYLGKIIKFTFSFNKTISC